MVFVATTTASFLHHSLRPYETRTSTVPIIKVAQGNSGLVHDANSFDILMNGDVTSAGSTMITYLRHHSIDENKLMSFAAHVTFPSMQCY
jgi:hypothetical protein